MSLRSISFDLEGHGRLTLLLRYRDLRRLERDHGIASEGLRAAVFSLEKQPTVLQVALEAGTRREWSAQSVEGVLDILPQGRLQFLLTRCIQESYGRLEPGDEVPDPKGEATASPGTPGSASSPSPSASA